MEMNLEWKSVENDGNPKKHGRYLVICTGIVMNYNSLKYSVLESIYGFADFCPCESSDGRRGWFMDNHNMEEEEYYASHIYYAMYEVEYWAKIDGFPSTTTLQAYNLHEKWVRDINERAEKASKEQIKKEGLERLEHSCDDWLIPMLKKQAEESRDGVKK